MRFTLPLANKWTTHLLCSFIFVLYIHEHLYKIWLSYYVMLNLIKVQHMYIWPWKQLKISVGWGRAGRGVRSGECGETHTFWISHYVEAELWFDMSSLWIWDRKGSMKSPLIVLGMFWSLKRQVGLAIHALDCKVIPVYEVTHQTANDLKCTHLQCVL